jgi:metal-sulfur cluster biosynthetic enzyme
VDIYELGLIYDVMVRSKNSDDIDLTRPVAESLPREVEEK